MTLSFLHPTSQPVPLFKVNQALDTRAALSFSTCGLSSKEELVFKSLMRLLDSRTHQKWFYAAEGADLRVTGENTSPQQAESNSKFFAVLTLGTVTRPQAAFLGLPLKAHELEAEINRLGSLLQPLAKPLVRLSDMPAIATPVEGPQTCAPHEPEASLALKLLRWPPPHLLNTADRIRLATVMSGRSICAADLAQRSGQSLVACQRFMGELLRASLAQQCDAHTQRLEPASTSRASSPLLPHVPQAQPHAASAMPSLLARIRSRFGFHFKPTAGQGPAMHAATE